MLLEHSMEFNRKIYKELKEWQTKAKRKPLLLMGARQIGKTTILKSFGANEYQDYVYLNLERQKELHEFFEGSKDPKAILDNLSLIHGADISETNSLVIIDEIQDCRDALIALKYFAEEMPEIHIIAAGSLLGLTLGNTKSFPVGKVEFLDMSPLSFSEFLEGSDPVLYKSYLHYLEVEKIEALPLAIYNPINEAFKEYLLIGGMPEVAAYYLEERDMERAQIIQDEILRAYQLDFVKHADKTTATKIQQVWDSLPSQLAKENKKFIYKLIRSGARAKEYEEALQWLVQAGLINKVSKISKPGVPLKAYEDVSSFKLYVFETGLLMRLANLDPRTFIQGDLFFTEFRGSLAENYVAQCLSIAKKRAPNYWASDYKAEVDFVQHFSGVNVPIEVKSGSIGKAKSLKSYKEKFDPKLRVRISNLNFNLRDDLLNIPLCYSEYADQFIEKAVGQLS